MSGETAAVSHLSVVMTTDQGETMTTASENCVTSSTSSSRGADLYFCCLVLIIGVTGTAANGLVLYALVASKQHKKHELIVNQNALDLYSCLCLVITYGLSLFNMHLTGSFGYWLCMLLLSNGLLYCGLYASYINLMLISIERYLKVVHPAWSNKYLCKRMTYAAIACAWIAGFVHEMAFAFDTSAVIDGVCFGYVIANNPKKLATGIYYVVFTYVFVLVIFVICYGKIVIVVRRQARVMAGHGEAHQNPALHQLQTDVIKTMILVCAFYAICWLPDKILILLVSLDLSLTYLDSGAYVTLFIGFLYICTNLTTII